MKQTNKLFAYGLCGLIAIGSIHQADAKGKKGKKNKKNEIHQTAESHRPKRHTGDSLYYGIDYFYYVEPPKPSMKDFKREIKKIIEKYRKESIKQMRGNRQAGSPTSSHNENWRPEMNGVTIPPGLQPAHEEDYYTYDSDAFAYAGHIYDNLMLFWYNNAVQQWFNEHYRLGEIPTQQAAQQFSQRLYWELEHEFNQMFNP